MGHTVLSQRRVVDLIITELKAYSKALREDERKTYLEMLQKPLKKIGAISYADSINVWAFVLLSIALEQEKRIKKLEAIHDILADGRVQKRG